MTRRIAIITALACALIGAGAAAIGCSTERGSTSDVSEVYSIGLTVPTRLDLPRCTSALAGTVAFVISPPSLWKCASNEWAVIPCTANTAGSVAYLSSTQTLYACVSRQWTPIALPEAGPPGRPGEAGAESLIKVTAEPAGPNCPAGGQRIDVGIDSDGDGVLQTSEITQTAYVCNGLNAGGAPADAGDAASDAPNALQQYAANYAQGFCAFNLRCCTGYPNGYDVAKCVAQQQTQGYENTLPGDPAAYTGGHLTLNQDAATGCISALTSVACGTTVTGAVNGSIVNPCFGVFQGTLSINSGGCVDSFECANGAYCNMAMDGGLLLVTDAGDASTYRMSGICSPLAGDGGACTTSQQCATATLQPTSYCTKELTLEAGTCQPLLPDNAGCSDPSGIFSDMVCQSELCAASLSDGGFGCGGSFPNDNTNGFCSFYADAGGGG